MCVLQVTMALQKFADFVSNLPLDMQEEIWDRLPFGYLIGAALWKEVVPLAKRAIIRSLTRSAATRRTEAEKKRLTCEAGGYNHANVTTIRLFYELLSQLRPNEPIPICSTNDPQ